MRVPLLIGIFLRKPQLFFKQEHLITKLGVRLIKGVLLCKTVCRLETHKIGCVFRNWGSTYKRDFTVIVTVSGPTQENISNFNHNFIDLYVQPHSCIRANGIPNQTILTLFATIPIDANVRTPSMKSCFINKFHVLWLEVKELSSNIVRSLTSGYM